MRKRASHSKKLSLGYFAYVVSTLAGHRETCDDPGNGEKIGPLHGAIFRPLHDRSNGRIIEQ